MLLLARLYEPTVRGFVIECLQPLPRFVAWPNSRRRVSVPIQPSPLHQPALFILRRGMELNPTGDNFDFFHYSLPLHENATTVRFSSGFLKQAELTYMQKLYSSAEFSLKTLVDALHARASDEPTVAGSLDSPLHEAFDPSEEPYADLDEEALQDLENQAAQEQAGPVNLAPAQDAGPSNSTTFAVAASAAVSLNQSHQLVQKPKRWAARGRRGGRRRKRTSHQLEKADVVRGTVVIDESPFEDGNLEDAAPIQPSAVLEKVSDGAHQATGAWPRSRQEQADEIRRKRRGLRRLAENRKQLFGGFGPYVKVQQDAALHPSHIHATSLPFSKGSGYIGHTRLDPSEKSLPRLRPLNAGESAENFAASIGYSYVKNDSRCVACSLPVADIHTPFTAGLLRSLQAETASRSQPRLDLQWT